jgi:uncharacterized protein YqgQ
MKSLYQINQDYFEIATTLEELEGELTPELEQALSINKNELVEKSHGYINVIKRIESDVTMFDAEIKRLQEAKKRMQKVVEVLEERLEDAVKIHGEIKTGTYTLKLRKSESVIIEDESKIPPQFIKIKQEFQVMKAEIKKAIKEGEEVDGAYIQENQNLVIK